MTIMIRMMIIMKMLIKMRTIYDHLLANQHEPY
jgi:hypothetical protein